MKKGSIVPILLIGGAALLLAKRASGGQSPIAANPQTSFDSYASPSSAIAVSDVQPEILLAAQMYGNAYAQQLQDAVAQNATAGAFYRSLGVPSIGPDAIVTLRGIQTPGRKLTADEATEAGQIHILSNMYEKFQYAQRKIQRSSTTNQTVINSLQGDYDAARQKIIDFLTSHPWLITLVPEVNFVL